MFKLISICFVYPLNTPPVTQQSELETAMLTSGTAATSYDSKIVKIVQLDVEDYDKLRLRVCKRKEKEVKVDFLVPDFTGHILYYT